MNPSARSCLICGQPIGDHPRLIMGGDADLPDLAHTDCFDRFFPSAGEVRRLLELDELDEGEFPNNQP